MAKHGRKRQKTSKEVPQPQPLGSNSALLNDNEKDDEERRLEELLFGTPFVPSQSKGKGKDFDLSLGLDENGTRILDLGAGKEMEGLLDSDLFYVDDGAPATGEGDGNDEPALEESDSVDSDSDSDSSSHSFVSKSSTSSRAPSEPRKTKSKRAPAWVDPADDPVSVLVAPGIASHSRLAKLRDAPNETSLSGREYERRLRRQFEKINPEPAWATSAREKVRGKRRRSSDTEDEDAPGGSETDDENFDHLLNSTSGVLSSVHKSRRAGKPSQIAPTTLHISRLRDVNQTAQASGCGQIKVVTFHPSASIPLLAVGSADRRLRLFNVDGHTSPLLQTLHVPTLPFSSTSATFHPLGNDILLTGARPFYYVYDMQSGNLRKSERGLWGTTFSGVNDPSAILRRNTQKGAGKPGKRSGPSTGEAIETHAFSPGDGSVLAVAGRGGYIHLVDWKSGTGQVISSMKMSGGVKGLWWGKLPSVGVDGDEEILGVGNGNAGATGDHLVSLSTDSEIYIWDVGARRCVRRWRDEGGFRGAGLVLAGSSDSNRCGMAIGSNTGLVNVYGADGLSPSVPSGGQTHPKPIKTLGNLITPITALRYNPDGQLLAMASQEKKDAFRIIHTQTLTSFANWPTSSTPLGHVTSMDFSAGSDYLAIGNTTGRVRLFYLRDYGV